MSNDPFIADLKADWQSPSPDVELLAPKVRRYRRMRRLSQAGEALGGLVAFIFGLWFAIMTWRNLDWAYGLSAAALLAAAVLIVISLVKGRRAAAAAAARSPFSTILEAHRHATATIDAMRRGRWAAWLLLLASTLGVGLEAGGLESGLGWPILAWLISALAILAGTGLRESQMRRLRDRCNALLSEWRSLDEAA